MNDPMTSIAAGHVKRFISERCVVDKDQHEECGALYLAFHAWTQTLGLPHVTPNAFGRVMGQQFKKFRASHARRYLGVRLLPARAA